jgi:hypothetical protein
MKLAARFAAQLFFDWFPVERFLFGPLVRSAFLFGWQC